MLSVINFDACPQLLPSLKFKIHKVGHVTEAMSTYGVIVVIMQQGTYSVCVPNLKSVALSVPNVYMGCNM